MKRLLATWVILLAGSSFGFAQGIHGSVKLNGKATVFVTGHSVLLTWQGSQGANSYNVYRGVAHGGPYVKLTSGITATTYADAQVTHDQTFYYVTTAVSGGMESGYSNEIVATIP